MFIIFQRYAFQVDEINENRFVYIGDFAFEIRARAMHQVNQHEITRLKKAKPPSGPIDPIEKSY